MEENLIMREEAAPQTPLFQNSQDDGLCQNNNINYEPPLSQTFMKNTCNYIRKSRIS